MRPNLFQSTLSPLTLAALDDTDETSHSPHYHTLPLNRKSSSTSTDSSSKSPASGSYSHLLRQQSSSSSSPLSPTLTTSVTPTQKLKFIEDTPDKSATKPDKSFDFTKSLLWDASC